MTTYISLLRAINVGGKNRISMPDLKVLYESLGLSQVETFLQSGNVIFDADPADAAALEKRLEARILTDLGCDVPVLIRTPGEFQQLVDNHPFIPQQLADPSLSAVTFFRAAPESSLVARLQIPAGSTDWFQLAGRELFLYCPDGFGRTKLTNAFFEKKLAVTGTSRNWKTVTALHYLAQTR